MGIDDFRINYRLQGFAITYQGDEIIGVDLKYGMTKLYMIYPYKFEQIRIIGVDDCE